MKKSAKDSFVRLFCSIKFVVTLLALIILTIISGTLIPQGALAQAYSARYGERLYRVLSFLRLTDVYHSWWFIGLVFFLWLSLLTCTLRQVKTWKKSLASLIAHLGLLIIIVGSLVTCIFGHTGFLVVYKGHSQDTFITAGNILKPLGFRIYLDDFEIEWYDATRSHIKDYRSKAVILDESGRPVFAKIIKVNHPLSFKGYTLCQASYDEKHGLWTGLQVSKDPGVQIVYAGFIFLNIGVIFIVSGKSKHK